MQCIYNSCFDYKSYSSGNPDWMSSPWEAARCSYTRKLSQRLSSQLSAVCYDSVTSKQPTR